MGALDDFRARFGGGGGKGSSTTGNILQDFESHFNVARLNPKNSQKAGGLNRLTEEQLASFGYKPSDIEDWNDLPERKQKKLEDVLTQISSSNISPYLAPGYKIGSISERDKGNPGQMQDLSTRGGLQAGLRGGAGGVLEGVIRGGSDMFGFGGHTAGEYTPQYLRQHPEVDRSALRESPESNGKAYVDRMNTPYTIKEPLEAGLNVALMRGAPATRFFGAGSTIAGRTAGAALKGGLENTAFGVATDLLNDKGTIEGRTRPFDGSFGSRVEAALTNAPSNFAAGAALGSVIGQKKKTSPDDNLTNIFFADKELRSLVKQQNSLEGVLGVINDANISKEVKRDLTKKVNTLSDTLALPEAKLPGKGKDIDPLLNEARQATGARSDYSPENLQANRQIRAKNASSITYADKKAIKPDELVTVYRAVPGKAKGGLTEGDWVTPNKEQARLFMKQSWAQDDTGAKIVTKKVKASELRYHADDAKGYVDDELLYVPKSDPLEALKQEARKYKSADEFVKNTDHTPQTTRVYIKSKFRDGGGYADVPVIREEKNITLYQGGTGENRQFWTPNKEYAKKFGNGEVVKKTGNFYQIDNGNRMTDVYVDADKQLTDLYNQATKGVEVKPKVELKQPDVPTNRMSEQEARDLTPPKRTTAVAETAPTVIRTSNSVDIAPKPISMAEVLAPDYAASQTKAIRDASKSGLRDRLSELRRKFTSTQIDDIGILDKTIKGKGLAADRDIGKLIDRSRRSDIMATRFGEDSGLNQIIRDYGDKGTFDEASIFLRDKRAVELYNKTGKNIAGVDLAKAAKNVDMNAAKYADLSARVKEYNNQFLDVVSGYGLISKDAAAYLKKEYPDYVPFNRVMDEIEKSFGGGSNASLSKQGVVQSIKGSEREINNVFENMYENMGRAFKQGEINNSAKTLSSYSEIPGNPFGIRELKPTEIVGNKNTFSYLDNGVKRTFEIKPEFMDAVKGMGNVELGVLGKVFAPATRVLKASATGLNVVFGVRNIPKDQQFSFIVSKHPILGLKNFFRAMGDVVGVGDFAKELQKYGGGSIEADVFRKMGKTVKQVRAERNLGSNIAFKSVRPNQWLRTLENTIGKTEELTRTQNARAYFESAIKSGKSKDIAMREAADAYNKVSVDFLRAGSIGRQLNAAIPFYNPGIQGTRTFLSAMKERPVQTGTKLIASVYLPMAALTAYNIADPARREIWNDIAPYDKEGNLILILPGAKKEGNGYTGVLKLPVNPAFSAINGLIGKTIEGTANTPDVARALLETVQPFPSEPRKLLGQLTPQLLKPSIEQAANHDFFTDSPIVSDSIKNKPLQEQKYDSTSGTAIQIGKLLGISPVRVEKFIKQNLAEVGNQGLNASDNVLAALGVIPKDQIGGRSIVGGLTGALTTARGGDRENTFYSTVNDASGARSSAVDKVNRAVNDGDYNLAKQLAQDYNRELDNKLSSFNSRFKKDSELEDALKRAYINDSDRALKSRKKK